MGALLIVIGPAMPIAVVSEAGAIAPGIVMFAWLFAAACLVSGWWILKAMAIRKHELDCHVHVARGILRELRTRLKGITI